MQRIDQGRDQQNKYDTDEKKEVEDPSDRPLPKIEYAVAAPKAQ